LEPLLPNAALVSARFDAQRFFVAAMILFMPSALILRFGFGGSGAAREAD
jgi:hypothetical protein